jgi:prepilin-type processing-associated H-X9-DG protein
MVFEAMQPDLVGFILNALEPHEQAEAEAYLQAHPEAQNRLETLRENLEPLSWDLVAAPRPGLTERTLAHVASAEVRPGRVGIAGMPWRRIIQAAAAVALVATAVGAGVSWIGRLYIQIPGGQPNPSQVIACKNNLHNLYVALSAYSDLNHGQFPSVSNVTDPARSVGGMVFAALKDCDLLPDNTQLACPANSGPSPVAVGLGEIKAMNDGERQKWAKGLENGYAYSLGYQQEGKAVGPRLEDGRPSSLMPLMADCSPPNPLGESQSATHGGSGQNVLYCDGHVAFCHSRNVGYNMDDIYLSRDKRVAAGVDWSDAVLASGTVPP